MKKLIQICFILCLASSAMAQASAEKVLRTYDWKDLMSQRPFPNSEIVSMDGMSVLKIENTNNAPLEVPLLTITNVSLIKRTLRISVETKFENVFGRNRMEGLGESSDGGSDELYTRPGMVEDNMRWFGDGGFGLYYFFPPAAAGGDETTNGSTIIIQGTSNWRRCYFENLGGTAKRVELSLFLPGPGTFYLRPIKLLTRQSSWLSPQLGIVIGGVGGICGAGIGCFGALIGCLVAFGKARRFVLATVKILIGLGILLMIGGIMAVAFKLPWPVWYTLLLMGFILTTVFSLNLYPIKRRYQDLEIRRMTSMDTPGR